jgi:TolB-like protein
MHRLLAAFALCSAFALVAAAPLVRPTATPIPLATATAAPTPPAIEPTVVVYPYDVGSGMPKDAGKQIQQILMQQLSHAGGVIVITPSVGVQRKDYLVSARNAHAAYYVSGFLTQVGDSAAMTTQLVATRSGIMLRSTTVQIQTAEDAAAQALFARDIMFADSGISQGQIATAPEDTPAPSSTDNGASVKIGGGMFGFLHRGKKSSNSKAAVTKPSRVAIVARVVGNLDGSGLTASTQHLRAQLERSFNTRLGDLESGTVGAKANAVCGSDRDATIIGGTISRTPGHLFHKESDVFKMRIYTCFGAVLDDEQGQGSSVNNAIDDAVKNYVTAHPENS